MKGSQVAGLTAGWLAVALSMAAIGTASVGRVGVDTAGPRAQVTVTKTVLVGDSASTSVAATDIAVVTSASTQPVAATVTAAQYVKPITPARTAAAAAKTSSALQTPPRSASPGPPTLGVPIVSAPVVGSTIVGVERPGDEDTASTWLPVPTKGGTKLASGTASTSPATVGVSTSTWRGAQGAIWAGCKASALTSLDPKPSKGYSVSARSTWLGTTITFVGPTTLSVLVRCSDGKSSFTIQG